MVREFKVPELGENVENGDVVSILVAVGDEISEGQPVLELETDKATVEVPSDRSGRVSEIHVGAGDQVRVGQVILTLEAQEASASEEEPAAEPPGAARKQPADEKAEASRKAASVDEPPPKVPGKPQDRSAGQVFEFRERVSGEASALVPASPAVRRFARELGIDLSGVTGSGPGGRISIEDVKAHSRTQNERAAPAGLPQAAELPDFSRFGTVEREKFSNVRRATASHLAQAWANVVHVTNHDRADVTVLEEARRRQAPGVEAAGGKLTMTAILLKVLVGALSKFPKFNASIDVVNQQIVYRRYFNLGVAVDTPKGLLVPVIRDVDRKNVTQLAVELKETAERARMGKISPDELQGGCFTVTNLGGIGGTSFTPVVNYPEAAILGVSRASVEPVFVGERFEPRTLLPLSLSYDHRLIDGADAARFLRWLAQALEDPFFLFLES